MRRGASKPLEERNWVRLWFDVLAARMQMRWLVLKPGIYSATFWAAALLAGEWLAHFGLASVAWVLLSFWIFLSLPVLYVDLLVLVDLMNYAFSRKMYLFPHLLRAGRAESPEEQRAALREIFPDRLIPSEPPDFTPLQRRLQRVLAPLAVLAQRTSPLACLSAWAIIVLLRAPAHIREHPNSARTAIAELHWAERLVYQRVAFASLGAAGH